MNISSEFDKSFKIEPESKPIECVLKAGTIRIFEFMMFFCRKLLYSCACTC